ncbi:MAG: hypothetical protein KatS3mg023_3865 [Armatimonadota bacterium]|nr:MAG: hypothetical protein KatS3mg023_3865 [Armatimonadota bacterium]
MLPPHHRDHLLENTHPNAKPFFYQLLYSARQLDLPLIIWDTYRTPQYQRALYAQGRKDSALIQIGYTPEELRHIRTAGYTHNKPILTSIRNPFIYTTGKAITIQWMNENGIPMLNPPEQAMNELLGLLCIQSHHVWGGYWPVKDYHHIQWKP